MHKISSSSIAKRWFHHNLTGCSKRSNFGIHIKRNGNGHGKNTSDGKLPSSSSSSSARAASPKPKILLTKNPQHQQDASSKSAVLPWWIVQHPSTVAIVPILGNVAYASLAGGFLCNDLLSLRILLICGYSGLVTYHALRPNPLLIPLRWSTFFVVVNVSMATMLILDSMPPTFTEEEEELHVQHFAPLSLKSFRSLMDLGTRSKYKDGELLTEANTPNDKLFFILSGKASMTNANGKHISKLQRGSFPNCMSFQRSGWNSTRRGGTDSSNTNDLSYGTVRCEGAVECIVWDRHNLLTLLSDDDDMKLRMDHVVIESVIRRLLIDSEGADVTDYIRVISQGWAHDEAVQRNSATIKDQLVEHAH